MNTAQAGPPGPGFQPVTEHARLVELSGGDPWLRWALEPTRLPRTWHHPGTGLVAILRTRRGPGRSLVLLATPTLDRTELDEADLDRALAVARPLLDALPAGWVTLADSLVDAGPAALGLAGSGVGWEWRWTTTAPPPVPGEDRIGPLPADRPEVAAELTEFLERHSPRHSARPGDPQVAGWFGVRDGAGALLACTARYEEVPGIPLLASVAVRPDARRHGWGAALTARITRDGLAAGAPAVTVDLYADNDPARRIYHRAGFRLAHQFTSWPMADHSSHPTESN